MQLDLFVDNRRTILLNDAADLLRRLELDKACALYDNLLEDEPEDVDLRGLKMEAATWQERLSRCTITEPQGLNELHCLIAKETSPALRNGILDFLYEQLLALPSAELVYIEPRFHLGILQWEMGRYTAGELWFAAALRAGIAPRGRFLVWRGDLLTLCGNDDVAMACYQAAFLEDPDTVDADTIANRTIRDLVSSMCSECLDEEHDDREALHWLPFWGWLQGAFSLGLNAIAHDRDSYITRLQKADDERTLLPGRLWYEYLRLAEYLRTCSLDNSLQVRVRKRMKQLNGNMFARYMNKVAGRTESSLR